MEKEKKRKKTGFMCARKKNIIGTEDHGRTYTTHMLTEHDK